MRTISQTIHSIAVIFKIIAGFLFLMGLGGILTDQLLRMLVQGFPTAEMYGDSWFLRLILQNFTLLAVLQILVSLLLYLTCRGFLRRQDWALSGLRLFSWFFMACNILAGIGFVTQAIPDTLGASANTFKAFIGSSAGLFSMIFLILIHRLNSPGLRQAFGEGGTGSNPPLTGLKGYHKSKDFRKVNSDKVESDQFR